MNREVTTPSTSRLGLTEQFALLELLLQEAADLARLFTLVKLLLNLLGPLLVQDLLLFGSLSNTKGVGKVNYIQFKSCNSVRRSKESYQIYRCYEPEMLRSI